MNILEQIIAYKKIEVETQKSSVTETVLLQSELFDRTSLSLKRILDSNETTGIIAEFKRRSPSKGLINQAADVSGITTGYTKYGAAGLSVLTDEYFFGAESRDLPSARQNNVPILRKEFIIDEYQLLASKAMGADVILLIAACLSPEEVKRLAVFAKSIGLEIILELHNDDELDHICAEVDIIGINNRNLKTFEVDIRHSIALSKLIPSGFSKIAESGIDSMETIHTFQEEGYDGFLIGELFMKEDDPVQAFCNFTTALKKYKSPV